MRFPFIAVGNELLLVVEKLLVPECGVFEVRSFDNGIDGAGFLAETTEDALGHVDVILGSTARTVRTRFRFNSNGKGRAGGLTELAGNASLLTGRVPSESMLTSEHRGQRSLFPRVVNNMIGLEGTPSSEEHGRPGELSHENLGV